MIEIKSKRALEGVDFEKRQSLETFQEIFDGLPNPHEDLFSILTVYDYDETSNAGRQLNRLMKTSINTTFNTMRLMICWL